MFDVFFLLLGYVFFAVEFILQTTANNLWFSKKKKTKSKENRQRYKINVKCSFFCVFFYPSAKALAITNPNVTNKNSKINKIITAIPPQTAQNNVKMPILYVISQ